MAVLIPEPAGGGLKPRRRAAPKRPRILGQLQLQLQIPEEPDPAISLALARIAREPGAAEAHRRWHAGLLVPHRITTALDIRRLDGPEVDAACGVEEPGVDLWELGLLYPEWEQALKLALLTDFPVAFFTDTSGGRPIRASDTSLRFHMPLGDEPDPVMAFTPTVIAATLESLGACPTCADPS